MSIHDIANELVMKPIEITYHDIDFAKTPPYGAILVVFISIAREVPQTMDLDVRSLLSLRAVSRNETNIVFSRLQRNYAAY